MRKLLKFLLKILVVLSLMVICSLVFLFFYYNSLEKKIIRESNSLKPIAEQPMIYNDNKAGIEYLNLLPQPQKVIIKGGEFAFPSIITYSVNDSLKDKTGHFLENIPGIKPRFQPAGGSVLFTYNKNIPEQGYNMKIDPWSISIEYSSLKGIYYATVSLKVLRHNYSGKIPCASIEDYPDLEVRGVMLDIGRNKIPAKETLIRIAGMLADLKYNHFELYIEGFAFAYPSFRELWEKTETPLTGEEIQELDAFCRNNFIDLVPNQNMFGHMMAWLATDRFKDLAESPKGFKLMGLVEMKGTLDPSDPRSLELVSQMTDDLLPNFSSVNYNVNLDEPFELGNGKSRKLVEEKGVGEVYMDYALKIHDLVSDRNRKMLMWGDIVLRDPETISRIPKDVTLLDWGYESMYPFEKNAAVLQSAGVNFMVCPGTSSWSSIVGRTDNMLANIRRAAAAGTKYGAKGMILTDWGDMGHWQYLPVSYPGYAAGSSLSWNSEDLSYNHLAKFMSSYMFKDKSDIMGKLALDLGRYQLFEEKKGVSMTWTMMAFQIGLRDRILENTVYDKMIDGISELMNEVAPELVSEFIEQSDNRNAFNYEGLYEMIDSAESLLLKTEMKGDDSLLIRDEYLNALRLLRLGTDKQYYVRFRHELAPAKQKELLVSMRNTCSGYLDENKRLWLIRNKPGGYEASIKVLDTLIRDIDKQLLLLDKSSFNRSLNRFFEKVTTAAAVLYIKSA